MNENTTARMLLTTAALAAVAALFAGGANAKPVDIDGGSASVAVTSPNVDRAVAAANKAYYTYRDKTAITAREALFTDPEPSLGLTGDSALTRTPGTVTPATGASADDSVDWSSVGLGAAMAALLAAGIAGVVLTTRRRGGIALP